MSVVFKGSETLLNKMIFKLQETDSGLIISNKPRLVKWYFGCKLFFNFSFKIIGEQIISHIFILKI